MHSKHTGWGFLAACLVLFTGCSLKKQWEIGADVPFGHAHLTIGKLLQIDDSLLNQDANGTYELTFNTELMRLNLLDVLRVPDTTITGSVSLDNIELGDREMERSITLGEIARENPLLYFFVASNHGKDAVVPPFSGLQAGETSIDATGFFESATFEEGTLTLSMQNNFPVDLQDIQLRVNNASGGESVISENIPEIKAGQAFSKDYDLAGMTLEGRLTARIDNISTPGSNGQPVPIDSNDNLLIRLVGKDMKVFEAVAVFPSQNLVDSDADIDYAIPGAEIRDMRLHHGVVVLTSTHTIQDQLRMHYALPNTQRGGVPFQHDFIIPAAPPGDSAHFEQRESVAGYTANMRGKSGEEYNSLYNIRQVAIDSTGEKRHLSKRDSIYIKYGLIEVVPDLAWGWLGDHAFSATGRAEFNTAFGNATMLQFPDARMRLQIVNGMGAPLEMKVNRVSALNTVRSTDVQLSYAPLIGNQAAILPAVLGLSNTTTYDLNASNSNIEQFIAIAPNQVEYAVEAKVNPEGTVKNHDQFISAGQPTYVTLQTVLPLKGSIEGLPLSDTIAWNTALDLAESGVTHLELIFDIDNTFPLEAQIQGYIYNNQGTLKDSLFAQGPARVVQGQSRLVSTITSATFDQLRHNGTLVLHGTLSTVPIGQVVTLTDQQYLNANIRARARYLSKF